jgi:hypothetical protein
MGKFFHLDSPAEFLPATEEQGICHREFHAAARMSGAQALQSEASRGADAAFCIFRMDRKSWISSVDEPAQASVLRGCNGTDIDYP